MYEKYARQVVSFEDVRPDLKRYYKPELNDGKLMSEWSANSHWKAALLCEVCNNIKTINIKNYCRQKSSFKCSYCNSLGNNYPELIKQWHPTKNNELSPYDFAPGSHKSVWWKCPKGDDHEWEAKIKKRTMGWGCPICSNYKTVKSNTLAHLFPEIAKDWNYDRNESTPEKIRATSGKKVWWKCGCGNEWEATVRKRTGIQKTGCPVCASSKGEKIIADFLNTVNVKYTSQYCVYVNNVKRFFDFYIHELNLYIEVHGKQHFQTGTGYFNSDYTKKQQEIDKRKQQYAEQQGHYIMVDYREHDPALALDRFREQFILFLDDETEGA